MKTTRGLMLALVAAVTLTACISDNRPDTCGQAEVTIQLTLTASSLTPNNPGVCRDQQVTMVIESDVDGYFHIHGYDAQVPVTPVSAGETERITFNAERIGQFPIELHPGDDPQGIGLGIFTVYEP